MMQVNWLVIIWEFTQIKRQKERVHAGTLKGLLSVTSPVVYVLLVNCVCVCVCVCVFGSTSQSKSLFYP